ncbi:MAG: sodium:solute symporter family protein [Methanosarcinaceae archaeon]|nr:sodium:solute symporter family protein [Methanosarcinaceae archaeon]
MDSLYLSVFIALLAVYVAVLFSVGWYFNKKQKSVTDFWIAGRKLGPIPIGFSAAASWITAGGLLSVIALFMVLGTGSVWEFAAPNVIALFIIALLVRKIKSLPSITQPELLEQRYAGIIRAPIAVIVVIVMMLFAASDISGLALVFELFFGISPIYAALLIGICVSVYVLLGGLSAVMWTDVLQFLLLTSVMIFAAVGVVGYSVGWFGGLETTTTLSDLFFSQSMAQENWWNPFSIGILGVVITSVAIIPGWFMEHDQWQKVWAAGDEKSARNGFFLGTILIFFVFCVLCLITAVGLRFLYPGLWQMPDVGLAVAESELGVLLFFTDNFSTPVLMFLALGLTAASMSCSDTFATSGGSCISRDLYQRYIKPDATMKEMKAVNSVAVVIIILGGIILSFLPINIIDFIHIATFIATAAYFFPLMGGLYWKRATKEGATASMIVGAAAQIIMSAYTVATGVTMTEIATGIAGEAVGSLFPCDGILLSLSLALIIYVGVSLMTPAPSKINLAPFFPDEAEDISRKESESVNRSSSEFREFLGDLAAEDIGDRTHLRLELTVDGNIDWKDFGDKIKEQAGSIWISPTGRDSLYRLSCSDMISCPRVTRGKDTQDIQIAAEPRLENKETGEIEMFLACREISKVLSDMKINVRISRQ